MKIQYSLQYPYPDITKTYEVRYEAPEFNGYTVAGSEAFTLSVTYHKDRVLDVSGSGQLKLLIPCDRCLSDVEVPASYEIEDAIRHSMPEKLHAKNIAAVEAAAKEAGQ